MELLKKLLLVFISHLMLISLFACVSSDKTGLSETENTTTLEDKPTTDENNNNETTDKPADTVTKEEDKHNFDNGYSYDYDSIFGDDHKHSSPFSVSKVFGSNMVLQRGEYLRVWGWARKSENGKKISASLMGLTADTIIANGEWEITFEQKLDACAELGNDLKVYTDSDEVVFEDVLIGDVYMVIGQSNVQYNVSQYLKSGKNLKWNINQLDSNSVIRMNYNSNTDSVGYPVRGTKTVCEDVVTNNGWVIPNSNNIGRLSAYGYFTALKLAEHTDNKIPIGISQFSASGRTLSVFLPNEIADKYGTDRFDAGKGVYVGNYHSSVVTRYMYNHYMYPYERMSIAGILWYQGESESAPLLSDAYVKKFSLLIEYMRSTHNLVNKDFPVFIMEFPSIYSKPSGYTGNWGYLDTGRIRAIMGRIPEVVPNSYIIGSSDLWNNREYADNVHPHCKYEQAERAAAAVNAVIYKKSGLDEVTGPILDSYEISADRKTITLKFKNYGDGLTTSDGSTNVIGFNCINAANALISNSDITATIIAPDTVVLTSSNVMYGVAYNAIAGYFYGEDINLCDSYGNPATAFWIYDNE